MTVVTTGEGARVTHAKIGLAVTRFRRASILVHHWSHCHPTIMTSAVPTRLFVPQSDVVQRPCRSQHQRDTSPISGYLGAPAHRGC